MPFSTEGTENQMRWDRSSKGAIEVWFATVNHAETGAGIWIRYTITSPTSGEPYCELWATRFDPHGKNTLGVRNRFAIDRLAATGRDDGAIVRIGDAWMSETHLDGEVTDEHHRIAWSLDIEPAERTFRHLPAARFSSGGEALLNAVLSEPLGAVPRRGHGR